MDEPDDDPDNNLDNDQEQDDDDLDDDDDDDDDDIDDDEEFDFNENNPGVDDSGEDISVASAAASSGSLAEKDFYQNNLVSLDTNSLSEQNGNKRTLEQSETSLLVVEDGRSRNGVMCQDSDRLGGDNKPPIKGGDKKTSIKEGDKKTSMKAGCDETMKFSDNNSIGDDLANRLCSTSIGELPSRKLGTTGGQ